MFNAIKHLPLFLLRQCKDQLAAEAEAETSPMLAAVKKTFTNVKDHTSRIYTHKHLMGLHGTGPFVCGVNSNLFSAVHDHYSFLPNLCLSALCSTS